MEQVLSCPSFQWGRCHVVSPFLACLPVGRGLTIMPRQQPSESRLEDSETRPRAIIRQSALPRGTGVEEGPSAPQQLPVLQDAKGSAEGGPVHAPDSQL